MATIDDLWRLELDEVLRSAGEQLIAFERAANAYYALDATTRAAVDRVASRVERADLGFHPDQVAVAVLDAATRGPAEFAAVLAGMGDDVPASWISRSSRCSSNRSIAWSTAAAAVGLVSPSRPLSFETVLDEVRRAKDTPFREARAALLENYRALDVGDAGDVCDRALALHAAEPHLRETCESIIERSACVVPGALRGRHGALLGAGILYPPWLFRGADDITRDRLISALQADSSEPATNHTLLALAWIGGEVVADRLLDWSSDTGARAWRDALHVLPRAYAEEAGWWLSETGERRALVNHDCRRLATVNTGTAGTMAFAPAGQACPSCTAPLSYAVDLGPTELAFLGHRGSRLRILTCERCTAFDTIYCEVTLDGVGRWSRHNSCAAEADREAWAPIGAHAMWLAAPVAPTEALARIAGDQSQLGGYPSWENDAIYPECPGCARPMPCIGQLAIADFNCGEGFIYLYLDAACGFAATTFEQT